MKPWRIAFVALAGAILLAGCGSTIPSGYKGVYRSYLGGTRAKVYKDGFKWHWPWNDVMAYDVRWKTLLEKISILSVDDLHMDVEIGLRLRPIAGEVYELHTQIGPEYYPQVVQQPFRAIALSVLAGYKYNDIPKNAEAIQDKILGEVRRALEGKHIEFDAVELRHIEYPAAVASATNEKLATQQLMQQKEFEKKIAEADAQIRIIEAHGQQQAQAIVDSTLSPMYLQYRAIDTQRLLANSPNATFYFVPVGKEGLPIIVQTPVPEKPAANVGLKTAATIR